MLISVSSSRTPHTAPRSLADIWGEAVQARREELKLSRAQLARIAEMTSQSIWLFETGQRVPLDRTKVELAKALGTTPGELFPWPPMEDLVA